VSAHPGFAPAKVNLYLHVGDPGADGFHPIHSLMVFADLGDELTLSPTSELEFTVDGAFADGLGQENLVVRARDMLLALVGTPPPSFGLNLMKNLPIASGLGGGSADAAATLRLVSARLGLDPAGEPVARIARTLGSDVPACLGGQPVLASRRGDELTPAPAWPALNVVLVNPLVPTPTAAVYRAYDAAPSPSGANAPDLAPVISARDAAAILRTCRNDLEDPAVRLRPEIGEVLSLLAAQPETLLARMSGSGATCFALCENGPSAAALEARIQARAPHWWVRRSVLAGRR